MRIKKSKLKRLIKEELQAVLNELGPAAVAGIAGETALSDVGIKKAVDVATGGKVSRAEKTATISKFERKLLDYIMTLKREVATLQKQVKDNRLGTDFNQEEINAHHPGYEHISKSAQMETKH